MKTIKNINRRDFLTTGVLVSFLPFTRPIGDSSKPTNSIKEGRRVVTGLNSKGKSIILSDGLVPENARWFFPKSNSGCDLWIEHRIPVDLNDFADPLVGYKSTTEPPPGGVTARIVTWQPGFSYPIHKTDTLDLIFVMSGRLELILDEGSSVLAAGDSVIQRGTNHGWRVDGDEPCTIVAVLLSAIKSQSSTSK